MKRVLLAVVVAVTGVVVVGAGLYATNSAPLVPTVTEAEAADTRPFVIKLHAQWCPKCMVTKSVWDEVETAYRGRAKFLVIDFTNDASIDRSRAEAYRVGLGDVFTEFAGVTGSVLVIDGRNKAVVTEISGSRDFAEYARAIDGVLAR